MLSKNRIVPHRFGSQGLQSGTATKGRTWFVEGYVSVAADSQKLEVDSAEVLDLYLVLLAVYREIERTPVRHVGIAIGNVDVTKEVFLHEVAIALRMARLQPYIFIQVEACYIGEIKPLMLVHFH